MCNKTTLDTVLKLTANRLQDIFGDKLKDVILYGSYARGDYDEQSDIDVFALVDMSDLELGRYIPEVASVTSNLDLEYNIVLSVILKDVNHFECWKNVVPFYANVLKEGRKINA